MMRLRFLPALVISSLHLAAFAESDFSGVWTASVCPSGSKNDPGKCSHFVLELFQRQDKLCGSHMFATSDATQVDESGGPSLTGSIADNTATVKVASTRVAGGVQVELKMVNGALRWHRLDKPGRNDLLPVNARFAKSRAKTLLNPIFAQQLSAACSMISNQPPEKDAPPATNQPHDQLHQMQKTGLAEHRGLF